MNNNTIESIEWHKDQLAKLLSDELEFGKVESTLDEILEKAKTKKRVLVRRGGKTFYREQEVGSDEKDKDPKPKKIDDKKSKSFDSRKDDELRSDLAGSYEYCNNYAGFIQAYGGDARVVENKSKTDKWSGDYRVIVPPEQKYKSEDGINLWMSQGRKKVK